MGPAQVAHCPLNWWGAAQTTVHLLQACSSSYSSSIPSPSEVIFNTWTFLSTKDTSQSVHTQIISKIANSPSTPSRNCWWGSPFWIHFACMGPTRGTQIKKLEPPRGPPSWVFPKTQTHATNTKPYVTFKHKVLHQSLPSLALYKRIISYSQSLQIQNPKSWQSFQRIWRASNPLCLFWTCILLTWNT